MTRPSGGPLEREAIARIRRRGPIPFDEVVDLALYDPDHGFYATGGAAGRRGDFLTSPEVGPLFGAVVASALDEVWRACGEPDPFTVVEAGAGRGALAISILAAAPACLPALTYVLVERSAALRAAQGEHLTITDPMLAFPPGSDLDDADHDHVGATPPGASRERGPATGDPERREGRDLGTATGWREGRDLGIAPGWREGRDLGTGPRVVSLGELPAVRVPGVVLANELLDNLAPKLLAFEDGAWAEVRVGLTGEEIPLREFLVPAGSLEREIVSRLVPSPAEGARVPVQVQGMDWLRRALGIVERGRVLVLDYADSTPSMASRPQDSWLRTYRGHERGGAPLDALGSQDITCEVAVDQLARVRAPSRERSQARFLEAHGIDALVAEGREVWHARAAIGDLAALAARSRVREAEALTDPAGLGAFRVLEWDVD